MTAEDQALANIAACHEALKAFAPIASPELIRDLLAAVGKHEAAVRKANGLETCESVLEGVLSEARMERLKKNCKADVSDLMMPKPTERAPLLKKKDIADIIEDAFPLAELDENKLARIVAFSVRDFYEALLTSGELIVAKTTKTDPCEQCGEDIYLETERGGWSPDYCPWCGAKVVK